MKNLQIVLNQLKQQRGNSTPSFFIPEAWNTVQYSQYNRDPKRPGEIKVDPYDFTISYLENLVLQRNLPMNDANPRALNINTPDLNTPLTRSIIYSILPRMFTAWEHYRKGEICSGTFLKAICLLPYLKTFQVDIIYLLPVFEYSNMYKKGELGSPYAIKNIYKLDRNLHDPLLGGNAAEMIETEFKAFVEACHILNIKVMVDFVFRTVSRDNDLIADHPDWFYWIDLKYNKTFAAPEVDKEETHTLLNNKALKSLYTAPNTKEYLSCFRIPPSQTDPGLWRQVVAESKQKGINILELIEREFAMTTAPGFSDVINDPQPPWTDVTYLKFYYDPHRRAKPYLDPKQPPYILQDGASLNLYHGEQINEELWEYVANIIPFYQQNFGIDGARIDMGHALPVQLNQAIVSRTKNINPFFILWSEEFDTTKAKAAKNDGFHFISGFSWGIYKSLENPDFNKRLFTDTLAKSALPITAALETPDTPRLAWAFQEKLKIVQLMMINCFISNAVVFINNGLEVMELQPMNLGLDNTEAGRFVLDKTDPLYGKLAFFDNYCIHWLNGEQEWMRQLLTCTLDLRRRYADLITAPRSFIRSEVSTSKNTQLTFIGYLNGKLNQGLFVLINRDFSTETKVRLNSLLPWRLRKKWRRANIINRNGNPCNEQWPMDLWQTLAPGASLIGLF
jgi:starch synthase (maltosyl-transferring)